MIRYLLAALFLLASCDICSAAPGSQACTYADCMESWTGDHAQGVGFCRAQAGF